MPTDRLKTGSDSVRSVNERGNQEGLDSHNHFVSNSCRVVLATADTWYLKRCSKDFVSSSWRSRLERQHRARVVRTSKVRVPIYPTVCGTGSNRNQRLYWICSPVSPMLVSKLISRAIVRAKIMVVSIYDIGNIYDSSF